MDWVVKNALNVDVERQHLNKILADIRATTDSIASAPAVPNTVIQNTITKYAVAQFTLGLTGAVTGSAVVDGTGDVTITTTLSDTAGLVTDSDQVNQAFVRWNKQWKIPQISDILGLQDALDSKTAATNPDAGAFLLIDPDAGESSAIPVGALNTVGNTGDGVLLVATIDPYGRVIGWRAALPDDIVADGLEYLVDTFGNYLLDTVGTFLTDTVTPSSGSGAPFQQVLEMVSVGF